MEKEDINLVDKNIKQFDFWSQNPCGTDGNLYKVMQQRYRIEPWLRKELRTIPTEYKKYLEIGCGQGVDSFYICSNLNKETKYIGIDYSPVCLKRAASLPLKYFYQPFFDLVVFYCRGYLANRYSSVPPSKFFCLMNNLHPFA